MSLHRILSEIQTILLYLLNAPRISSESASPEDLFQLIVTSEITIIVKQYKINLPFSDVNI